MNNNENKKWNILTKIGEGQFSKVYTIEQEMNNTKVYRALKYIDYSSLKNNQVLLNEVKKEIEIIKIVNNHPNIIEYYDYNDNEMTNSIFITMELLTNIKTYFQDKSITQAEVVKIGKDMCNALKIFHSNNLIHSDIKPSNIFINNNGTYKLGDFSITTRLNNPSYNGTPNYMAPEYLTEKKNNQSDIYSLGLVMYTLLNKGKLPFEKESVSCYNAIDIRNSGKKIPKIRGINKKLMNIILKSLEFAQNNRYKSVEEMEKDLNSLNLDVLNSSTKEIKFAKFDTTLDVNSKEVRNSFITKIELLREKYTLKYMIQKIILLLVLIVIATTGTYLFMINRTCGRGFVNNKGFCVKGKYTCSKGYFLDKNKCKKVTEQAVARENYYCPTGYILNDRYCVNKETKSPSFIYKCADGFTLEGTNCVKEESAEAALIYYCPDNYVLAGTKCVTADSSRNATKSYSCPDSSYTRRDNKCYKTKQVWTDAIVTYGCPYGGTVSGTQCDRVTSPSYNNNNNWGGWGYNPWLPGSGGSTPTCSQGTYSASDGKCHSTYTATKSYTCTSGTSNGAGKCVKSSNVSVPATTTYTCPSGYINIGDKCTTSNTINATPKYTCTTDTTLRGNMCYGKIVTQAIGIYNCEAGYILSGVNCIKDDFKKPEVKQTCSRLYKLNGNRCEKYKVINAKINLEKE